MLGNDVVDLRDPDARPESFRGGFDERVFSEEERYVIGRDAQPLARRWAHWAAKEAAYKLARQIDSTFVFSPRRLVANYADSTLVTDVDTRRGDEGNRAACVRERRGTLELPPMGRQGIPKLELRSYETTERVHVIAVLAGSIWSRVTTAVEMLGEKTKDPSVAVRSMAVRDLSRSLGVVADRLWIGREDRIPIVELDGSRTPIRLSLSHHGRWISYAARIPTEMQVQSVWMGECESNDSVVGVSKSLGPSGAVWTL